MPTGYDNKAKDDSPVNKSTRGNKSKTNAQTGKIIKVKSSMKKSDVETKSAAGQKDSIMISDDTDEKNQTGKLPKRSNETNYMAQMLAGNIFTHLTEEDTDLR